jgi:cysteinyl-tRNA synthetase
MTVRFFMLQSHYSSTLDFSNEALQAAEKGFRRLSGALSIIKAVPQDVSFDAPGELSVEIEKLCDDCYLNMSDDFNTAKTLAVLFELSGRINDIKSGNLPVSRVGRQAFEKLRTTYIAMMEQVLGLEEETQSNNSLLDGTIKVLIGLRKKARLDRNYALSDKIRDDLKSIGIQLKDGKDGEITYSIEQ